MANDRRDLARRFMAADAAYRCGDVHALRRALGDPADFPNCVQPAALGMGDTPLGYAIAWSPLAFIAELLALGADPNAQDPCGFPSLIAALTTARPDRCAVVQLLLEYGADVQQRGLNDWTPMHVAVAERDLGAVTLLLAAGADPSARTRIDCKTTPLQDAEVLGFAEAVAALRRAIG